MKKQENPSSSLVSAIVFTIAFLIIIAVFSVVIHKETKSTDKNTVKNEIETKKPDNPNEISEAFNNFYNNFNDAENEVKFRKTFSILNTAFALYCALGNNDIGNLTGIDLADIVFNALTENNTKASPSIVYHKDDVIGLSEGIECKFETYGSNCLNGGCYVFIDVNGFEKGPNKIYEGGKPIYDRLRVLITRGDKYGDLEIKSPMDELIYKDR